MRSHIRRKMARNMILAGLKTAQEDGILPNLPDESFWLGSSDQLAREQIMTALLAFDLTLDLTSCNSGNRNLYDLLDSYLRNPSARNDLNDVLKAYGKIIH